MAIKKTTVADGGARAAGIKVKKVGLGRLKKKKVAREIPGTLEHTFERCPGGTAQAIEYLRIAAAKAQIGEPADDRLAKWLELREEMTPQQIRYCDPTMLDLCMKVGISVGDLFGAVCGIAFELSAHQQQLLMATWMPEVVLTSLKEAKKTTGGEDRSALLKQAGIHHAGNGTNVNVQTTLSQVNQTAIMERKGLPEFAEEIHDLDSRSQSRALPASSAEPIELERVQEAELIEAKG